MISSQHDQHTQHTQHDQHDLHNQIDQPDQPGQHEQPDRPYLQLEKKDNDKDTWAACGHTKVADSHLL